jgi:hypothetical protein
MNYLLPLTSFLSLCFIIFFSLDYATAESIDDSDWSYSVKNGIINTKRSYILVYEFRDYLSGKRTTKKIYVVSQCSNPTYSEKTYGNCNHQISIEPTGLKFSLNTGEDVVIAHTDFDITILGTIDYGCCAPSENTNFYTDTGKYLGEFRGGNFFRRGKNVFTDSYYFNNLTNEHNDLQYLIIDGDPKINQYFIWTIKPNGEMKKQSILLSVSDYGECKGWGFLEVLHNTNERKDNIELELSGLMCEPQTKIFTCQNEASIISCVPQKKHK